MTTPLRSPSTAATDLSPGGMAVTSPGAQAGSGSSESGPVSAQAQANLSSVMDSLAVAAMTTRQGLANQGAGHIAQSLAHLGQLVDQARKVLSDTPPSSTDPVPASNANATVADPKHQSQPPFS